MTETIARFVEAMATLADLFGASRYAPRAVALSSDRLLLLLYLATDTVIGISCAVIGATLILHRQDALRFMRLIYFQPMTVYLLGMVLLACACNYATSIATLWLGVYYLDWFSHALTAGVSLTTAAMTVHAFYFEKALPSVAEALGSPKRDRTG